MAEDAVLATAAVQRLGALRSEQWPLVAAQLLALGLDGPDLLALACLPGAVNGGDVDHLVPGALTEINAPDLTVDAAAEIFARLLAAVTEPGHGHPVVRTLAAYFAPLGYPDGLIAEAFDLAEWLDCDCDEGFDYRDAADSFEALWHALPLLEVPRALAEALTS